jgi:hypothetical protein
MVFSQAINSSPVWVGLKRILSRAFASAGMTLVAGLPMSMVVI